MTHKVHPKSYRIRRIEDYLTRGYYKNPAQYLEEDFKIREFLNEKTKTFKVEKIEIERSPGKLVIIIFSAHPGLIIGRGGEGIEKLKKELQQKVLKQSFLERKKKQEEENKKNPKKSKSEDKMEVKIEIREIRDFWGSATLVGQWMAQRLEKRIPFRKVLKQALSKVMLDKGVEGAKIEVAGRLNGAEIARKEWVSEGKLPRQTIRADIDYAKVEANCTYGVIGIKIWVYKGEKFDK